jgi:hypothetical protein
MSDSGSYNGDWGDPSAGRIGPPARLNGRTRADTEDRYRRELDPMTAGSLADLIPYVSSRLFRPDFLRLVAADAHRPFLDGIGLRRLLGAEATVRDLLEQVYDGMRSAYRTEYLYKNEVLRRIVIARHDPNRTTVLLEKPIARWASRLDMLVVNDTTTAYEIKTDHDDLGRVRKQTDLALEAFDRVYVACSERWVPAIKETVDDRVGIVAMRRKGTFTRVRPAKPNAHKVDPGAVFPLLRQTEYLAAIEDLIGPVPPVDDVTRYGICFELFMGLSGTAAHSVLLAALKNRFLTGTDAQQLRGLPYSLAHLYYQATVRERQHLFSPAVLGRTVG